MHGGWSSERKQCLDAHVIINAGQARARFECSRARRSCEAELDVRRDRSQFIGYVLCFLRCARPRCIGATGGGIHDVPHERDELLARSDTSGMIAERCATTGRCKARCSAPLTKAAARGVHRRDLLPAPLAVVLLGGILAADALHMTAIASAAERMIRLRARSRGVRLAARSQKQAASGTPTGARTESRPTLNGVHALGRRNWLSEPTSAARAARIRATCAHYETPHTRYTQLM